MASSTEDVGTRSEAPSTCGDWPASDEDEVEDAENAKEGIVQVCVLGNENVDVWNDGMYETTLVADHGVIEVESEGVENDAGIAYEIEVEYEEMPQAPEAQDVVVPPLAIFPLLRVFVPTSARTWRRLCTTSQIHSVSS